eukprot:NODE_13746_length_1149_cov_4.699609.p1 GENE.NODE_13746_length_1149_cov_4.699609~~NODE_13746_length_1149_cov_4.699609.p1  ORF type:complete len:308 (+),score=68.97 NODE_13746_length_1149_cov_4.699609:161-1084(+)
MAALEAAAAPPRDASRWGAGVLASSPGFEGKLAQLRRGGASKLHIITDFDRTLTACDAQECHNVIATLPTAGGVDGTAFREALAPFFDFSEGSFARTLTRDQWWGKTAELMVRHGICREELEANVRAGAGVALRPGAAELLKLAQQRGVPVTIVSAGVNTVIEETLRLNGITFGTGGATLACNRMVFSGEGGSGPLARIEPEECPVTPERKPTTIMRFLELGLLPPDYSGHVCGRPHLLILGDQPPDATVSLPPVLLGSEPCVRLAVGWYGQSRSDRKVFEEAYDMLLPGSSAGLEGIVALLRELAD